jgi:hypothetical protein
MYQTVTAFTLPITYTAEYSFEWVILAIWPYQSGFDLITTDEGFKNIPTELYFTYFG